MHTLYKGMLALTLSTAAVSTAGAQVLNRQVTASSGGVGKVNDKDFQFTIGDLATTTLSKGSLLITQGFQQPEELPPVDPGTKTVLNMILYPNPAATSVKIEFDMVAANSVYLMIVNSSGQLVYKDYRVYGAGRIIITLPVDHFAAGIYTVRVQAGGYAFQDKLIIQ
ncbi:T9SS type A sorting domain-containing protein [Chitinophaga silvisoli]|uniref:T9SS C-terminal target domain-containing protein n=1 Tax=Chitinophaga silvisoli TaxID=2291814 RepID=A0A3E1NYK3_9BACT|nr:T9SS type A sorting domain-containing protein [Chitinophaga silvisoli]RFM33011.1 T9SS C-terminal target domain-containing protein [Chitinophaga silvisoli]